MCGFLEFRCRRFATGGRSGASARRVRGDREHDVSTNLKSHALADASDAPDAKAEARGRAWRSSLASLAGFWLDHKSDVSLRLQLYRQLRDVVLSRQLPPGMRLPAT